MRHKNITII